MSSRVCGAIWVRSRILTSTPVSSHSFSLLLLLGGKGEPSGSENKMSSSQWGWQGVSGSFLLRAIQETVMKQNLALRNLTPRLCVCVCVCVHTGKLTFIIKCASETLQKLCRVCANSFLVPNPSALPLRHRVLLTAQERGRNLDTNLKALFAQQEPSFFS